MEKGLKDLKVVFFESRLAETMASLIKLQGGFPVSAPSMKEVPLENNREVFLFGEKLFSGEVGALVLLTGVGTKYLLSVLETRYPREKILETLRKTKIIPRGPKPIRVLKELEIPFAVTVPEPNTWKEILETLDKNKNLTPISGKLVAVQEYGVSNPELIAGLKDRGANVFCVPVYRWALPDDLQPLKNAIQQIIQGEVQTVIFTTAVQVEHLFKVAGQMNVEAPLKHAFPKMAVASVGPDCSAALQSHGIHVDIEPESPKMGPLVVKTAEKAKEILSRKR